MAGETWLAVDLLQILKRHLPPPAGPQDPERNDASLGDAAHANWHKPYNRPLTPSRFRGGHVVEQPLALRAAARLVATATVNQPAPIPAEIELGTVAL